MLSRGSALLARIIASVGTGHSASSQESLRAICTSVASLRNLHEPLAPTRPPGSKSSNRASFDYDTVKRIPILPQICPLLNVSLITSYCSSRRCGEGQLSGGIS